MKFLSSCLILLLPFLFLSAEKKVVFIAGKKATVTFLTNILREVNYSQDISMMQMWGLSPLWSRMMVTLKTLVS